MKAPAVLARRPALLALGGLAVLAAWLFRDALLGGVYYKRDVHLVWHAQVEGFVRAVTAGAWPLWNPSLGFGRPLLADPSAQILYPLTWLNLVMRPWTYYTLFVVLHALLSAVGLFLLARRLGRTTAAAFVSASVWMLSGPYLSGVDLWHHFAGVSWLPWVVLVADSALERRSVGGALAWGFIQGVQILAGSADACTMTAIAVVAIALSRHASWNRQTFALNLRLLGTCALAAVVAVGLTAALWMPALDQVTRAARSDLPPEIRTYWSVHPWSVLETLLPGLWSTLPLSAALRKSLFESREPFLASLYLGAGALGLVVTALVASKDRLKWVVVALGLASVLVALGSHAPFYGLAAALIPPLRILRYPVKIMVLAAFAWSLLAGMGLDCWRTDDASRRPRWKWIAAMLTAFSALALTGAGLALWGDGSWAARWLDLPAGLTARLVLFSTAARLGVAGAFGITGAVLAWRRSSTSGPLLGAAMAVLAIVDLAAYHRHPNPTTAVSLYNYRPAVLDLLEADPRVYVYDYSVPGSARRHLGRDNAYVMARQPDGWTLDAAAALAMQMYLAPESGGRFGLRGSYEIDYRGLYPRDLELFTRLLRRVEGTDLHLRFLALAGVTNVVALHAQGFEDLERVGQVPGLFRESTLVFRVPHPLPRTYAVGRARGALGQEAVAALMAPSFDARGELIVSEAAATGTASAFSGTSRILSSKADRVVIEAAMNAPGYVVLLDGYDPGWHATVDGEPAPVVRANVAFRAVAAPAGRHVIEQVYRPRPVLLGLALSGTTILGLLGVAFLRERGGPSGSREDGGESR